ncbi:MAG TPA: nuclear transport factor 2 family protein [Thermoleophilaceae bacterium]
MPSVLLDRVLQVYEALNRDDLDSIVPYVHPHVEWHTGGLLPQLEPVEHGVEGMRRWWSAVKEPWESFGIGLERHLEAENTVTTWIAFDAVAAGSGVEVALGLAHVFEFEGGQIRRHRTYVCFEEAMRNVRAAATR